MGLCDKSAFELSGLLERREVSSVEVTQSVLDRIASKDKTLNAYITVCGQNALAMAKSVDKRRMSGECLSPLAGIPVAVKDNICVKGVRMTCGSKMLENFVAPYNATVIDKLEQAGAVIVGKLNMDEFAMGSSSETSYFGAVRNPHDTSCVAGGSSGGCAAAVSAGETILALGSDTGGSIRQPAAFCGIVGLKPTYGCVSRYGLTAFASSFDQIGPMGRCVKDTALLLGVIAGQDVRDMTCAKRQYGDFYKSLKSDVKGIKIGVPWSLFEGCTQGDVLTKFEQALKVYKDLGAQIVDIKLDNTQFALPAYYVISSAEASSNLARFDGVRYGFRAQGVSELDDMYIKTRSQGFGDECKRRIMLGTFVLSAGYYDDYYKKAVTAARLIKTAFKQQFESVDVIAMPTSPETAFKLGKKLDDPIKMYGSDIFTVFANLTGMPAISVPCGFGEDGLPVGLQLMADSFCEQILLDAAYAFECAVGSGVER